MARQYTMVCDCCGKKGTEKSPILSCQGKREDGMKFAVDLCKTCWRGSEKDYGVHEEETRVRKEFEVIPYDQIPRTEA